VPFDNKNDIACFFACLMKYEKERIEKLPDFDKQEENGCSASESF
jgi:hypothetical protein